MAFLLGCESISLEYPTKKVFDSVTLGVNDGDRIGIVGRNGDGKSTLLSLLAGTCEPQNGRVIRRGGTTIGTLEQADKLNPDETVGHEIVGETPEYVWASDPRVRGIINGLIADIPWDSRIGTLSGGQRRRVDLARVLIGDYDALMLDEPTNHLDVRGIAWLADHLNHRWAKKSGALLIVTHDRWFLDEVCLEMWEVHDGQVDPFEGGYSAYVLQRVEREQAAQVAEQKRKNLMRKELAWLSRGARARSSKPKFHLEIARALIDDEPPARNPLELKRTAISRLGKQVVDLIDVTERFGDKTVIDDVTWLIGPGDRFGILGENGAGKSTLLDIIQGVLKPSSGRVKIGQTVKFAVLSQHLRELDKWNDSRVREILSQYKTRYEIDGREMTPAQLLEHLGFETTQLSTPVSDLSGGQRRRLQLMLILLDKPNVLILDEPGNDLDTDMLTVMENLLDTWPGTLLLVTHDRYLMERVTDDQYALIDGKITHVPGGVDEYLQRLEQRDRKKTEVKAEKVNTKKGLAGLQSEGKGKPVLSQSEDRALKKELASTERKLRALGTKADTVQARMHETEPADYVTLGELEKELQDVRQEISTLEDRWIELSDKLA